jgi:hypothetical protein
MKQKFKQISLSETLKNKLDVRMRQIGLRTYTEVLELFLEQTGGLEVVNLVDESKNYFIDLENILF